MSTTKAAMGTNHEEWAQAGEKAASVASAAGEMASHAASAVSEMATKAAGDVGKKADELTASVGAGIWGMGDKFSKNSPHTGVVGDASQAVARTIKEGGQYVEGAKLSGMADDVAHLIRRNPIPSVLIAIGLGWFVASKLRH